MCVTFEVPGTYDVTGTWTENGVPRTGTLRVRAVSASFSPNTALWVNHPRDWLNPGLPGDVNVECDEGLRVQEYLPPPFNVRAFQLDAYRVGAHTVLGRLGRNGPVIGSAKFDAFDLLSSNQTGIGPTGEVLPDGSLMVAMKVSAGDLPVGASIRLHIFVSGVTFDDGSIDRWITRDDLDANGLVDVRFIYHSGLPTSVCHYLEVWQDGEKIGTR